MFFVIDNATFRSTARHLILVAPVIRKGETIRKLTLPEGLWRGFNGKEYAGKTEISILVTLADLPYFERIK